MHNCQQKKQPNITNWGYQDRAKFKNRGSALIEGRKCDTEI